jgi:hypothetical protein
VPLKIVTKQLYLSSKFADVYSNIADNNTVRFRSYLNKSLVLEHGESAKVLLRSCEIPIMFYQVDDYNGNDTLRVTNGANAAINVIATPGSYAGDALGVDLSNQILADTGVAVLVEYDEDSNMFFITNNGAANITLDFDAGMDLSDVLGFNKGVPFVIVPGDVLVAPNVAMLSPISTIHLHSNLPIANTFSNKKKGQTTVLDTFPTGDVGTNQFYVNSNSHFKSDLTTDTISQIELWLTDDTGTYINIKDSNWSCSLVIEIYSHI